MSTDDDDCVVRLQGGPNNSNSYIQGQSTSAQSTDNDGDFDNSPLLGHSSAVVDALLGGERVCMCVTMPVRAFEHQNTRTILDTDGTDTGYLVVTNFRVSFILDAYVEGKRVDKGVLLAALGSGKSFPMFSFPLAYVRGVKSQLIFPFRFEYFCECFLMTI
jgi:hypothetical protein